MKFYYYSEKFDKLVEVNAPYEFEDAIQVKFEGDYQDYLEHPEKYVLEGRLFKKK